MPRRGPPGSRSISPIPSTNSASGVATISALRASMFAEMLWRSARATNSSAFEAKLE